jgi:hypothetical protein
MYNFSSDVSRHIFLCSYDLDRFRVIDEESEATLKQCKVCWPCISKHRRK